MLLELFIIRYGVPLLKEGSVTVRHSLDSPIGSDPWIKLSDTQATVQKESRLWVSIDWRKVQGTANGTVTITQAGGPAVTVQVTAFNPTFPRRGAVGGFIETDGCVSIEAAHYTDKIDASSIKWKEIPNYGRTLSAMTIFPVTAESITPSSQSPHLEYRMYLFDSGQANVTTILAPSLNFVPGRGLRYAVSFDDQPPVVVDALADISDASWNKSVIDNAREVTTQLTVDKPGYHTLKFWMVDPGIVLEKLVVDMGGVKPSFLGPPESYHDGVHAAAE